MKNNSHLITGLCVAAFAFCGSLQAAEKTSPAPKKDATAEAPAKPPRPTSYHGNASAIDQSAKTFSLVGKKNTRVIKVTDKSTVTKAGASAGLSDLTENEYVSGSYWKHEDGTLEAKTLKIGGKTEAEKAAATTKKAKKDAKKTDAEPAAEEKN
ncbi:MAG: hypothetical protein ABIR71_04920 [Chthoniobacterales bacterium]